MAIKGESVVQTVINYEIPPERGGDVATYPGTTAIYLEKLDETPQTVHDVRGHESNFSLDVHGFEFHHHPTKETFEDQDKIKQEHYNEVAELLKSKYVTPLR